MQYENPAPNQKESMERINKFGACSKIEYAGEFINVYDDSYPLITGEAFGCNQHKSN